MVIVNWPHAGGLPILIAEKEKPLPNSFMGLFDIAHELKDGADIIRITVAGGLEKPYFLYEARSLKLNDAFMTNLELLTPDGKPNMAAYLLADENGTSVQVAKYADTTRVDLIENRDYGRCSLVKALKSILERMDVENTIYTKIGYPLRQEREMIDSTAMREAVINAIVHNDYSYGATPKFEFFSDRLEITSMGGLPYGVSEEDFFSGFSIPRNKEIMRVFRDLDIVEQLGSGVPRILKIYSRDVFEIRKSFVRVIFTYAGSLHPDADEAAHLTTEVRVLKVISGEMSRLELMTALSLKNDEHFRKAYLI